MSDRAVTIPLDTALMALWDEIEDLAHDDECAIERDPENTSSCTCHVGELADRWQDALHEDAALRGVVRSARELVDMDGAGGEAARMADLVDALEALDRARRTTGGPDAEE